MRRVHVVLLSSAVAWIGAGVGACSASTSRTEDNPLVPDSGTSGDAATDSGGLVLKDSGGASFDVDPDVTSGGDCTEANKQIYIVTETYDLKRFSPATLTIADIGPLKCPSGGISTPFSMAVDRSGTAWVLYNDGKIYKASTKDASCTATKFVPDQAGFHTFGMGFVSDSSGSATETLYVADYLGTGLAKINTSTLVLKFVGDYGSPLGAGELTGTGTARLFAFFNQDPVQVAELDKTTGKAKTVKSVAGLTVGSGWAFAHWGGSFWLFTAPGLGSQITKYDFDTGKSSTVKTGLGYVIVGAGVSTCAPTTPPK